jgi:BlaI family penicillinase repressor
MADIPNIAESEWLIMEVLWERGTATSLEISQEVTARRGIAPGTVKALINRLLNKRAITFDRDEKDSRVYHYRPLVARDRQVGQKNTSLLNLAYDSNPMKLLASFVESSTLSASDIEELRRLLDAKEGR